MLSRVWSAVTIGVDALPVEVETHIEPNLPRWTVVGLPDGAVRESRDRVVAALKKQRAPPPRGAVTVNLAPADVRKEGSAFDLPIALGLLAAAGHVPQERLDGAVVLGRALARRVAAARARRAPGGHRGAGGGAAHGGRPARERRRGLGGGGGGGVRRGDAHRGVRAAGGGARRALPPKRRAVRPAARRGPRTGPTCAGRRG
jgi:hypothetical protein